MAFIASILLPELPELPELPKPPRLTPDDELLLELGGVTTDPVEERIVAPDGGDEENPITLPPFIEPP